MNFVDLGQITTEKVALDHIIILGVGGEAELLLALQNIINLVEMDFQLLWLVLDLSILVNIIGGSK